MHSGKQKRSLIALGPFVMVVRFRHVFVICCSVSWTHGLTSNKDMPRLNPLGSRLRRSLTGIGKVYLEKIVFFIFIRVCCVNKSRNSHFMKFK